MCRSSVSAACSRSHGRWRSARTLLLARDERELAVLDAEDDEHEVLLADAPQDAMTLIEDEVLLVLPFAPRCERAACADSAARGAGPGAAAGSPRLRRWQD